MEALVPLVGVRSGVGGQDRVRARLDEVKERPGDAVAVVGAEAGNERTGFFSSDRLRDRFELLNAPVELFFARVAVGKWAAATNTCTSGLMGE
ncbi:hypothetical protein LUX09_33920 [Streptomyces albogriseolus]|nr:hypothetical protein [Streptomyces albogriseolus]